MRKKKTGAASVKHTMPGAFGAGAGMMPGMMPKVAKPKKGKKAKGY